MLICKKRIQEYQQIAKQVFPPHSKADADGLLAHGGELTPAFLISAYCYGVFPWYTRGEPILWWSPDPRLIMRPAKFKITSSLKQSIRKKAFEVRFDTCFEEVIQQCAHIERPDQPGTWLTGDMMDAYTELYNLGIAHSTEIFQNNELVGGLYGLSIGRVFFGESMFFKVRDASKVALFHLTEKLKSWNFDLIDAQVPTNHLLSLGAELVERSKFLTLLEEALKFDTIQGNWGKIDHP